ncbi:MAG: CvpA family protein [Ferruginibacter sp.]
MIIDLLFAILLVMAAIKGYRKGLILAVFSLLAFFVGLAAALKLSAVVAGYLKDSISVSARWLPFLSFLLVFLGVVLLVHWGGKLVETSFQAIMLGWVNRIAGILLYAVIYTLIFSIFLFYAQNLHLLKPASFQDSQTYSFIAPWGPRALDGLGKLIPVFRDSFTDLQHFFGNLPLQSP